MSFHNERQVKLRKDRYCDGCHCHMTKEQDCIKAAGKVSYDFYSTYICLECQDFMIKHPNYFEDGWYEGDIGEARRFESLEN